MDPVAGQFDTVDTRIVDRTGRTIIPRGVNVVYKRDPYYPPPDLFDEDDVAQIAEWGFTVVRLGFQWCGLEPERGALDRAYLERMRELIRQFDDHGVSVLIDMHQDLYGLELGGDGAPGWATYTDGKLSSYDYDDVSRWELNYIKPAVARAFDSFWLNRAGLLDRFASTWRRVAEAVVDEPNVIGYEPLNEPMSGYWTAPFFEQVWLPGMYNRVIEAIRRVDEETPIWIEPAAYFNQGIRTRLAGVVDPAESLVFSYHNYAQILQMLAEAVFPGFACHHRVLDNELVMDNATRAMRGHGIPGVLTEFSSVGELHLIRLLRMAERDGVGWLWWPYDESDPGWTSPAEHPPGHHGLAGGNRHGVLDYLVRPGPTAIAGRHVWSDFDRLSRTFVCRYEATDAAAPSTVFVPGRQFDDPDIDVRGAAETDLTGEYLTITARDHSTVRLTITEPRSYRLTTADDRQLTATASGVTVEPVDDETAQRWVVVPVDRWQFPRRYVLRSPTRDAVLTVESGSLDLRAYTGQASQEWNLEPRCGVRYRIVNDDTGATMHARSPGTAPPVALARAGTGDWAFTDGQAAGGTDAA